MTEEKDAGPRDRDDYRAWLRWAEYNEYWRSSWPDHCKQSVALALAKLLVNDESKPLPRYRGHMK